MCAVLCRGVCCRCEDDLTHKLVEIIRANITLKRMMANGSPQHILNEYVSLLQVRGGHVSTRAVGCAHAPTAWRHPGVCHILQFLFLLTCRAPGPAAPVPHPKSAVRAELGRPDGMSSHLAGCASCCVPVSCSSTW